MERLRMSKASSSPWPAGAGVINKAMSCVENPVQTGVWGSELCDLVTLPAAEPDFRAKLVRDFVCIIVPASRFFQLADRHLFWVVTSVWHLGVDGGTGAWWRCHGVGMPPGFWILWWGKGSGSGGHDWKHFQRPGPWTYSTWSWRQWVISL